MKSLTTRLVAILVAAGMALAWMTVARAAAPSWSQAAPMAEPRILMTATTLPDGRVLLAGGANAAGSIALSSAEIYDPASDTWLAAGALSQPRYYHVAAALGDGRVLVAGGLGGDPAGSTTADIYDPASGAWSPAAPMNRVRIAASAVTLSDGRVLVIGGFNQGTVQVQMDAEIYDPVANTWTLTGPTTGSRFFGTSQVLPDGRVLAAGGYDNIVFGSVDSAEVFDPQTNAWTAIAPMHASRVFPVSVTLADGRIMVIGGAQAPTTVLWMDGEIYDPASDSWTLTPSNGAAGGIFAAAATRVDGHVLVAGGVVDTSNAPTNAAALYDPSTNSWSALPPMAEAREAHAVVRIPGARTLVAGGVNAAGVEVFGAPNNPPIANAGVDQPLQGCGGCLAVALLDASASEDADGDALTYTWSEGSSVLASTRHATTTAGFALGTHIVTLTVTDGAGGRATDTVTITVNDAIASMSGQIAELQAQLAAAQTTIGGLNAALAQVEQDMRREFRNPQFTIPGQTPGARLDALANAIVELNHGSKQQLYRELQGR
jgi:N-acetylneuraminic acid mutarotase